MRNDQRQAKKALQTKIIVCTLLVIWLIIILTVIFTNRKDSVTSANANLENSDTFANIESEIVANETINIEDLTNEKQSEVSNEEVSSNTTANDKQISSSTENNKSSLPYYIKVNYGAQVVNIYTQDENGDYTVPYKVMVCSTGVYTPKSGVYSIPARWEWLGLQGNVYGHYSTQIKGNILFHSVPYLTKWDNASLEYWEYDKLGTYASAGCIRLTVEDAKWIYYNCARGTKVEFYSDSNPGPLGKPSAKKISSYPDYLRNWDPTDPAPENPWHSYSESNNNNNSNTNTEPEPTPKPEPTPTPPEGNTTDIPSQNPGTENNTDVQNPDSGASDNTDIQNPGAGNNTDVSKPDGNNSESENTDVPDSNNDIIAGIVDNSEN